MFLEILLFISLFIFIRILVIEFLSIKLIIEIKSDK